MLDVVADVGWNAHDVERCIDGLDLERADVSGLLFDVVSRPDLHPVSIVQEEEVRVICGACSLCYAILNRVFDTHFAEKLLNIGLPPEDRKVDV